MSKGICIGLTALICAVLVMAMGCEDEVDRPLINITGDRNSVYTFISAQTGDEIPDIYMEGSDNKVYVIDAQSGDVVALVTAEQAVEMVEAESGGGE